MVQMSACCRQWKRPGKRLPIPIDLSKPTLQILQFDSADFAGFFKQAALGDVSASRAKGQEERRTMVFPARHAKIKQVGELSNFGKS